MLRKVRRGNLQRSVASPELYRGNRARFNVNMSYNNDDQVCETKAFEDLFLVRFAQARSFEKFSCTHCSFCSASCEIIEHGTFALASTCNPMKDYSFVKVSEVSNGRKPT